MSLVPALLRIALLPAAERVRGFIVPDTNRLLAVRERWAGRWHVIHIESGHAVMPPGKATLSTREQATGFARRFYTQCAAHEIDLAADWAEIQRALTLMSHTERAAFWLDVL